MKLTYSERLSALFTKANEGENYGMFDGADSSCTVGYNTDGSTVFEIFENGFYLGVAVAKMSLERGEQQQVFYAAGEDDTSYSFVVAATEDEAVQKMQKLFDEETYQQQQDRQIKGE